MRNTLPLWDRLTNVPGDVPRELSRYYVYWKIFYVFAGIDHALVLITFYQAGVYAMVIANIFSVGVFVAASLLLRKGWYQFAYWIAIGELVVHGILATICVGSQFAFTNYTFLVVILLFIQPFYSWRVSFVLAVATVASAAVVTDYSLNNSPLYVMSPDWASTMIIRQVVGWPIFVLIMVLPFILASARAETDLAAAYAESERLLLNILPESVARRLKSSTEMIADDRESVAILFADIVGFTALSARMSPKDVVTLLNDVFYAIDELVAKYGLEKIKTVGDAYVIAAGLPDPIDDPNGKVAKLAIELLETIANFRRLSGNDRLEMRIGINSGRVVAGVIGNRKFAYDLWGDAVNVAARMEETGVAGKIQVPTEFAKGLQGRFTFEPRGAIDIKGKGLIQTSFLVGELPGND
ncbi:hypothetical protein GFL80_25145 [Rhizobium leguminosarum bv. viciae]|uniref:adenylate/guanylate cyclase domain-containing protein n=1 Tax=Rhizobium leguminosarum TaxID=384 RepID=UPI0014411057|nr:adenylate/guanylate cyclase domain-containing protein [Rhizobium leguminosarum]NKK87453.1 hypothetical protein [Rhizobium leguminosarum bv. viciae]